METASLPWVVCGPPLCWVTLSPSPHLPNVSGRRSSKGLQLHAMGLLVLGEFIHLSPVAVGERLAPRTA